MVRERDESERLERENEFEIKGKRIRGSNLGHGHRRIYRQIFSMVTRCGSPKQSVPLNMFTVKVSLQKKWRVPSDLVSQHSG